MANIDFSKVITASAKVIAEQEAFADVATKIVANAVEEVAKSKGYDSAAQLVSYSNSTVEAWKAESDVFSAWRDNVWVTLFGRLQIIKEDPSKIPQDPEDILIMLPQIEWPE